MNFRRYPRPITREKGAMNGTEKAYASLLELQKRAGAILDYRFEAVKLRLADLTFYSPDFLVVKEDCFELHEVKGGFIRDDAMVKIKVAAESFPWIKFMLCQYKGKQWRIHEV